MKFPLFRKPDGRQLRDMYCPHCRQVLRLVPG